MPVLQFTPMTIATSGVYPHIMYIDTNDTVAQVTTPGYLNSFYIWGNSLDERYIALVSTKTSPNAAATNVDFYDVSFDSATQNWSLIPSSSAGQVLPGAINELAYYAAAGDIVSGLATANRGVLVTSATGVPSILAPSATTGLILKSNAAAAPSWSASVFPDAGAAGTFMRSDGTHWTVSTLTIPNTYAINTIPYASSANVLAPVAAAVGGVMISNNLGVPSMLANPTATGRVLTSVNGAAAVWSTGAFPTTAGAAGTFLRSNGTDWVPSTPTLANTYAVNTLLYAASADAVSGLATANGAVLATNASGVPSMVALTDGQIIIGDTGGAALAANITGGTGISVVNGANSITINQTGGGMSWNIGLTPGTVTVNNAYVDTIGGQTYVLPANANVGDMVRVVGSAAGNWVLQAGAGDIIHLGTATTSGGGTLTATDDHDSVEVVCIVANSEWTVLSVVSAGLTVA